MISRSSIHTSIRCLLLMLAAIMFAQRAAAQDRVGGHFGVVFPLVTRASGQTTTIGDDLKIGFPMGVTVKKSGTWALDLELVPVIQKAPLTVSLTVHPGVIRALSGGYAAGVRMAFDVDGASWGFTPLINRALPVRGHGYSTFAEGVVPIRFQRDASGATRTSIGLGAHVGVGF